MNKSSKELRKKKYLLHLNLCDSDKLKIDILLDRVLELEDIIQDLKIHRIETLSYIKNVYSSDID